MKVQDYAKKYLEYCEFRKELDKKTLKAYRIDLRQYFDFLNSDNPQKGEIEDYITNLHKKFKPKTVKRKIAAVKAFYTYLEEEELTEDMKEKLIEKVIVYPGDRIEIVWKFEGRLNN